MLAWMTKICDEQPARVSITFGGDLNDYAGIPDPSYVVDEYNPIGELAPQREHYCMGRVREFMERFGLCLINTFVGGQDTYFGRTHSARIDYFGAPRSWLSAVVHSRVLERIGRRLQMTPIRQRWDHWPLQTQ
eukprot:1503523-Pyramimonas_sp.AAC.1